MLSRRDGCLGGVCRYRPSRLGVAPPAGEILVPFESRMRGARWRRLEVVCNWFY